MVCKLCGKEEALFSTGLCERCSQIEAYGKFKDEEESSYDVHQPSDEDADYQTLKDGALKNIEHDVGKAKEHFKKSAIERQMWVAVKLTSSGVPKEKISEVHFDFEKLAMDNFEKIYGVPVYLSVAGVNECGTGATVLAENPEKGLKIVEASTKDIYFKK